MPAASQESPESVIICPKCQGPLTPVRQARYGGPRFHAELLVFRCAEHGEVFVTREGMRGPADGDDPASTGVPDGPAPLPQAGAAGDPESDR